MVICTSVLFTKLTSPEVRVLEPPVHVTATVGGLAKPFPLTEMVCKLLDPVTGFGLTPLIVGTPAPVSYWLNGRALDGKFEVAPPGAEYKTYMSWTSKKD